VRLSAVQREAVGHPGSLSLVSCPGSGKTRTLVAKLLATVDEVRDGTRLIACITYTNAAVNEIEVRVGQASASALDLCEVETIHSFCLKHILACHSWRLPGFADGFSVLAPEDPVFIEITSGVIKACGLNQRAQGEFEQLSRGSGVFPDAITKQAAEMYWAALDSRCLMDFSCMIYWSAKLVDDVPYIARGLASRFRWILVDEFQDTSLLQVGILRAIHRHARTKFFIVGDPFQSIMSFAGAHPALFDKFGQEIGSRSDLQLLSNYRSSLRILKLADSLCRRPAPMEAVGVERNHPHEPCWHSVTSMPAGVADVFLPEVKKYGIRLSEVAVLANRWTSLIPLARGLRDRQIPTVGPGSRPYKRANHLLAPLVEQVAAQASEPRRSGGFAQVRREIRRLVQTVTKGSLADLGFAGDVASTRLIRSAQNLAGLGDPATSFLTAFGNQVAEELRRAGFLSKEQSQLVERSGPAMVADIAAHESEHKMRTITIRDLGLFARGSESVRLMTMHGSKGREFDAVALVDVFDGHVPFFKATPGDEIEAEGRRLLYVAMTRARKLLMVFTLTSYSDKKSPSRFLREVFLSGPSRR
jgi:DNA helicase-2/ATP-dependent DNA helicase PcrA